MKTKERKLPCVGRICTKESDSDRVKELEHELKIKKEELSLTEKKLQKKIKELTKLDKKTKSQSITFKKAKKKLEQVTSAVEKCQKYERRSKKCKKKKNRMLVDKVHNFFDKVIALDSDCKGITKVNKYDLLATMRRTLLHQTPMVTDHQHSRYYNNRPSKSERKWNTAARDCYLMSLQRSPQLWINHRWPQFYPQYLSARQQWKNLRFILLFLLGILFWVPAILCLEIYQLFMHGLHLIDFPDNDDYNSEKNGKQNEEHNLYSSREVKDELVSQLFEPQIPVNPDNIFKNWPFNKSRDDLSRHNKGAFSTSVLLRDRRHRKKKVLPNPTLCSNTIKEKFIKLCRECDKSKPKKTVPLKKNTDNSLEILYQSNNWKSRRKEKGSKADFRKYAIYFNSKSSCDLKEAQKRALRHRKNNFNKLNIPQGCHRHTSLQAHYCKHKYCRHFYSDHALRDNFNSKNNAPCPHQVHKLTATYNVVDFPNATIAKPETSCINAVNYEYIIPSPCKARLIPSRTEHIKGGGDITPSLAIQTSIYSTKQREKPVNIKTTCSKRSVPNYKRRRGKKTTRTVRPIYSLLAKALKYAFLGFAILLLFPCILVMSLLWILSCRMRPHEILKTANDIESCKYKSCQSQDNDAFWTSIYSFVVAVARKWTHVFETFYSSIKPKSNERNRNLHQNIINGTGCHTSNRNKRYPNPRKKYNLFYDNDRGWLIKPTKTEQRKKNPEHSSGLKEMTIKNSDFHIENERNFKPEFHSRADAILPVDQNQVLIDESNYCKTIKDNKPPYSDTHNSKNVEETRCTCDPYAKFHSVGVNNRTDDVSDRESNVVGKSTKKSRDHCYKTHKVPRLSSIKKPEKGVTFNQKRQTNIPLSNVYSRPVFEKVLCPFHADYYKDKEVSQVSSPQSHAKQEIYHREQNRPPVPQSQQCMCRYKRIKQTQRTLSSSSSNWENETETSNAYN
ncbi:unnamed protein product [Leptosia nina]|uniref:Uncharacterized protein n=1 Tax=Leptosia nina TaxID=320188 RepID=A0AAV1JBH0_9NEOP